MKDMGILCPSCYRQHGLQVVIYPKSVLYRLPTSGAELTMLVYECTNVVYDNKGRPIPCRYTTTEHELLFHEFRVKYHELLQIVLNIRGWVKSKTNSPPGIIWVINRAVENYFEKGKGNV